MKITKVILLLSLFLGISFACQEEKVEPLEETAVVFELELMDPGSNARAAEDEEPGVTALIPTCQEGAVAKLFAEIKDAAGVSTVFSGEIIPQWFPALGKWQIVIDFLEPGTYQLTTFLALDNLDNVIFATPQIGSEFAVFVENPLARVFEVVQGAKVKSIARLLCIHPGEIPKFGVKVFEFDVISIFNIYFFENYCDPYLGHLKGDVEVYVVLPFDRDGDGYYDYYGSSVVEGLTCIPIPDVWSLDDYEEYVELYIYTEGHGVLHAVVSIAVLKYYKDKVIHLFYECDWYPDWCEPCDCSHDDQ